jgi:hypothetical protein
MRDPFFQGFARDQGGSLKKLHRPSRYRRGCLSLKGGEGIHVMAGVNPGYLNVGLMKPRRGFTLVAGNKKLGLGKKFRFGSSLAHPGFSWSGHPVEGSP